MAPVKFNMELTNYFCHIKGIWQNFYIMAAILDFDIFPNANCCDNYLIHHYTSTTSMVDMTKTMKQQGISLWPSCGYKHLSKMGLLAAIFNRI